MHRGGVACWLVAALVEPMAGAMLALAFIHPSFIYARSSYLLSGLKSSLIRPPASFQTSLKAIFYNYGNLTEQEHCYYFFIQSIQHLAYFAQT